MDVRSVARDPATVAVVAGDDDLLDVGSLDLGRELGRTVVVDRYGPEWAPRDAIECGDVDVVVLGQFEHAATIELTRAVREVDPECPVIAYPPTGSVDAAAELTRVGVCAYLPRDRGYDEAALASEIVDRIVEADRRRQHRYERELFQLLLSNAPKSIYVKDREGRHVAVSDGVDAAVEERMIGKTDFDLYADDIGEAAARNALEDDLSVVESGEPVVGKEERHVKEDGEVMWLRTTKLPWRRDGNVVGLVGFTEIVTEQKAREEKLERQQQRLEQFAGFASHDLRNPVNVAEGYLELAKESGDEAALDEVAASLDRMDRLIDDLLQLATPADDREEHEWVALAPLVRRVWSAIDAAGATLEIDVHDDVEIYANGGGLRQLLENVVSNSVEHGEDDVIVTVGVTDTGFYVADDGPGIDPEDRERVFEYGHTTGGTGIGLVIAQEIATTHGWEALVSESISGGARFEFDRCILRRPETCDLDEGASVPLADQTAVGNAMPPGAATDHGDGSWTLSGGGRNLWGEVEEYYAVHVSVEGSVRVDATVADVEWVHEFSKAGVFVKGDISSAGPFGFVGMTAGRGAETLWRTEPDADITSRRFEWLDAFPRRIRIDRIGDRLTVWASTDDDAWTPIDQCTLPLADSVAVGILVCGHNEHHRCEATFDDVRVVRLDPSNAPGE